MTIITIMMIIDDDSNGICWIIIDDDNLGKEGHRFFCCHALVLPFLGVSKEIGAGSDSDPNSQSYWVDVFYWIPKKHYQTHHRLSESIRWLRCTQEPDGLSLRLGQMCPNPSGPVCCAHQTGGWHDLHVGKMGNSSIDGFEKDLVSSSNCMSILERRIIDGFRLQNVFLSG